VQLCGGYSYFFRVNETERRRVCDLGELLFSVFFFLQAAGDVALAIQCLNLCLCADSTHASAFNNLAVLHHKTGKTHLAKAYLASAKGHQPALPEPKYNLDILQETP